MMVAPNNPCAVVEVILCLSLQKLLQARISFTYISALSGDLLLNHLYYLHSSLDRNYDGRCMYCCVLGTRHGVLIDNWMY
jgi:hypothetical protein